MSHLPSFTSEFMNVLAQLEDTSKPMVSSVEIEKSTSYYGIHLERQKNKTVALHMMQGNIAYYLKFAVVLIVVTIDQSNQKFV